MSINVLSAVEFTTRLKQDTKMTCNVSYLWHFIPIQAWVISQLKMVQKKPSVIHICRHNNFCSSKIWSFVDETLDSNKFSTCLNVKWGCNFKIFWQRKFSTTQLIKIWKAWRACMFWFNTSVIELIFFRILTPSKNSAYG